MRSKENKSEKGVLEEEEKRKKVKRPKAEGRKKTGPQKVGKVCKRAKEYTQYSQGISYLLSYDLARDHPKVGRCFSPSRY